MLLSFEGLLERRITALESQAESEGGNLAARFVSVEAGETSEQATVKAGYFTRRRQDDVRLSCEVGAAKSRARTAKRPKRAEHTQPSPRVFSFARDMAPCRPYSDTTGYGR